jgi:hypothetical protein
MIEFWFLYEYCGRVIRLGPAQGSPPWERKSIILSPLLSHLSHVFCLLRSHASCLTCLKLSVSTTLSLSYESVACTSVEHRVFYSTDSIYFIMSPCLKSPPSILLFHPYDTSLLSHALASSFCVIPLFHAQVSSLTSQASSLLPYVTSLLSHASGLTLLCHTPVSCSGIKPYNTSFKSLALQVFCPIPQVSSFCVRPLSHAQVSNLMSQALMLLPYVTSLLSHASVLKLLCHIPVSCSGIKPYVTIFKSPALRHKSPVSCLRP